MPSPSSRNAEHGSKLFKNCHLRETFHCTEMQCIHPTSFPEALTLNPADMKTPKIADEWTAKTTTTLVENRRCNAAAKQDEYKIPDQSAFHHHDIFPLVPLTTRCHRPIEVQDRWREQPLCSRAAMEEASRNVEDTATGLRMTTCGE